MATQTNIITKQVVFFLRKNGYVAWRQNNGAVYDPTTKRFRKRGTESMDGVPDIMGFCKATGRALYAEVKFGKDRLSQAQESFLKAAKMAGCETYLVTDFESFKQEFWKSRNNKGGL